MKVLIAPNMNRVYMAGHEFGATHYIVAGSYEDAWDEYLTDIAETERCDHGGDITDEQRFMQMAGDLEGTCDCDMTDDGQFVNVIYKWMRPLKLTVDQFMRAIDDETGQLA